MGLVFVGIAVADQPSTAVLATATLNATTKSNARTHTCGSVENTKATYTGSADSLESALKGSLSIRVNSTFNTATHLGTLRGHWTIDTSAPGNTGGTLAAVNNNGTITGWLEGRAPGGKKVAGTFSGSWSKDGGFSSLQIGTSSSSNVLVVTSGHCNEKG